MPKEYWDIVSTGMNDYRQIYRKDPIHHDKYPLTIWDTNGFHELSVQFIEEELQKPFDGKIIVMTHHIPSFESVGDHPDPDNIRHGYASDLTALIQRNPNIMYWFCGHAHDYNVTQVGETSVVRNPLGYVEYGQGKGFLRDLVFDV